VVSSSSSLDSEEDKKHDNYDSILDAKVKSMIQSAFLESKTNPTHIGGARLDRSDEKINLSKKNPSGLNHLDKKSVEFIPKINKKNLKEVFKYTNYYSRSEVEKLVGERILKWRLRSMPELLNLQSTNDSRLKKAENDLAQLTKKVPKWLVAKRAILRLLASKQEAEAAAEQAALDRATLLARQEQEKRDQRRALENAKRAREDLRDAMMQFRTKKPHVPPVSVHFSEPIADEYDLRDGFAVEDHESESGTSSSSESSDESSDDEVGALSDAITDLEVGEATVENLDN